MARRCEERQNVSNGTLTRVKEGKGGGKREMVIERERVKESDREGERERE